jgi:O-antigen ligase
MAALIITLLVASLTSNLVPTFNVIAILALFPLYLFWSRSGRPDQRLEPKTAIRFLLCAYAFWIFSYLLTGAPLANLFSYEFLRFDGAILVGYLPLLLLRDCGLKPRYVNRLLWGYLAILSCAAILGVLQFVGQVGGLDYEEEPTGIHLNVLYKSYLTTDIFHGWFRAHNAAGSIYGMAACFALAFALGRGKVKILSWPILGFAAALTGLVLSQSRSGYVAFTAAFLVVFVRTKRYTKGLLKIGTLIGLPLMVFLLSQALILRRVQWIGNFDDPNVVGRFVAYQEAVRDLVISPLIGIGFGRYNDDWQTFSGVPHFAYIATGGQVVNLDTHAHNSYLHFLAEGGVVGLFLMLGIWVATYRWAGRLRSMFSETSQIGMLAQGIQASVIVLLCFSFTEHALGTGFGPLTLFTFVGLLRNVAAHEGKAGAGMHAIGMGSNHLIPHGPGAPA